MIFNMLYTVRSSKEDASTQVEKEREFYGKIVDERELAKATTIIKIEQYGVFVEHSDKNCCSAQLRVRKEVIDGEDPVYTFATKTPIEGGGKLETEIPTNEAHFIQFMNICDSGMVYTRHVFPIEGTEMKWEIDCVETGTGGYRETVKVDLELKGEVTEIPAFPIQLEDVIVKDNVSNTPEEREKIKNIIETLFRVPNPLLRSK